MKITITPDQARQIAADAADTGGVDIDAAIEALNVVITDAAEAGQLTVVVDYSSVTEASLISNTLRAAGYVTSLSSGSTEVVIFW